MNFKTYFETYIIFSPFSPEKHKSMTGKHKEINKNIFILIFVKIKFSKVKIIMHQEIIKIAVE